MDAILGLHDVPLWYWLPFTGVALVLTLLAYLVYSGLLAAIDVQAKEPNFGDLTVAYKTGTGPYKNCGELFTEVSCLTTLSFPIHHGLKFKTLLMQVSCLLPDRDCIGIYYDDPDAVAPDELRYAVGAVISDADQEGDEEREKKDVHTMLKEGQVS